MNEYEYVDKYGYMRGLVGTSSDGRAFLDRFIVSNRSQRRQGHGRAMLNKFIAKAREAGNAAIYTIVDTDRSDDHGAAVGFLKKTGFTYKGNTPIGPMYQFTLESPGSN